MTDQITTHVLDLARGTPVAGVEIKLYRDSDQGWERIAQRHTDADGRVVSWPGAQFDRHLQAGTYKLGYDTAPYFSARNQPTFYPHIEVMFQISGDGQHYHVPLLLSPFGYSTYRGS